MPIYHGNMVVENWHKSQVNRFTWLWLLLWFLNWTTFKKDFEHFVQYGVLIHLRICKITTQITLIHELLEESAVYYTDVYQQVNVTKTCLFYVFREDENLGKMESGVNYRNADHSFSRNIIERKRKKCLIVHDFYRLITIF